MTVAMARWRLLGKDKLKHYFRVIVPFYFLLSVYWALLKLSVGQTMSEALGM